MSATRSTSRSETSAQDHELQNLRLELDEIRDENNKLRLIETQFWLLLNEKEDIKQELDSLREASVNVAHLQQQQHGTQRPSAGTTGGKHQPTSAGTVAHHVATGNVRMLSQSAQEGLIATLHEENDTLSNAVKECTELLLSKEAKQGNFIASRGPVSAFLSWLELGQERADTLTGLTAARDDVGVPGALASRSSKTTRAFSPGYTGGISNDEKEALLRELHTLKREIQHLQEELDRTDMSRMQALEDSERMQSQLETVLTNISELRTAYLAVKSQAESNVKNAQVIQSQKVQLANKDAQIHELKGIISQMQRMSDVGGAELAADAARIRLDLLKRSSQTPTSASATSQSPQPLEN